MYLMIRNLGVADYRGFTKIGVSTTRNAGAAGTIGQFGSGSKLALALFLRYGINVTIICGNLKMTFGTKEIIVKGESFQEVFVEYSGKDIDGTTNNRTEDLGFVTSWGTQDWTKPAMAFREFISNAIDGSIVSGGNHQNVELELVDKPRAKSGYTSVFIEYTPEVELCHKALPDLFLHFRNPELLKKKCLPKADVREQKTRIYKNGVLVSRLDMPSVCDYNLGNELALDESRNASEWDVKYAVAHAIRRENENNLTTIIKGVLAQPDCFEAKLDKDYFQNNVNATPEVQAERKKNFQNAWTRAAGEKAVVTSGNVGIDSFVQRKGLVAKPITFGWMKALESYDVASESSVLDKSEASGNETTDASPEMQNCVDKVWKVFEAFGLTNNKDKPQVKSFKSIMNGGSQTHGYYLTGDNCIYLHESLGVGKMMFKVTLEEIVHYTTGSDDNSRDIQDFLFNLVTEMAY